MPFTVSHAIVAVPFARTVLPAAAVASGAMAPDLPLFLPVGVDYAHTHELPWFLVTSIPLAFVALVLWRVAVRPAAPLVAPGWIARRLPAEWSGTARDGWDSLWRPSARPRSLDIPTQSHGDRDRDEGERGTRAVGPGAAARSALLLLAALAIGVVTHVFWDGFTHTGRWGTLLFPVLDDTVAGSTGASWLHYISSFLGFAALVVWAALWLRRRDPRPASVERRRRTAAVMFWSVVAAAFVVASLSAVLSTPPIESTAGVVDLAFTWVTQVGAAVAVGAVAAGVLVQLLARRP